MGKIKLKSKTLRDNEWEIVEDISQQGYRDDSPYRNRKSIDIHTNSGLIDMSETGIPIFANGRFLPPYSGMHQFEPGIVKEERIMQNGGKISLDEFRPKFANSNETIQQQMLQQKPMVKNLPEVEIVANKTRYNPYVEGNRNSQGAWNIPASQVAGSVFSFVPEAFHTPSRLVNQGIGLIKDNNPNYDSEISETLGLQNNDPTDMWAGVRNFAVDNVADVVFPSVGKGIKNIANYAGDISKINNELKILRTEGLSKGLSENEIRTLQMNKIGITDNQRKAFTPVVSDILSKYVKPISYEEGIVSKLKDIPKNIKQGGWKNDPNYLNYQHLGKREDAWNLYLGKPQVNNTFRYSQTVPRTRIVPELQNNIDSYHLNYEKDLSDFVTFMDNSKNRYGKLLKGETIYPSDAGVMGGYNLTRADGNIGKSGIGQVEYNDIWDLHPQTTLRSIFPEKIAKNKWLNDNVFYKTSAEGISSPRQIELKMENFIGKPFLSHGRVPVDFPELVDVNLFHNAYSNEKLYELMKSKGYNPKIKKFGGKVKLKPKSSDWEIV